MMTELPSVLFHRSPGSVRRTQAFATILHCTTTISLEIGRVVHEPWRGPCVALALRLDNNLALHAFVPKAAGMATLKGIRSWRLGKELNHGRFPLL